MHHCRIHDRGMVDYTAAWQAMQTFTQTRTSACADEIWRLQHPPVYTRGRNAQVATPLGTIPTVASDRGGDITYHGPGQLVVYVLFDLARAGLGVKNLVHALEQSVIDWLASYAVIADRRDGAPGVYVGQAKIAALGLRVRRGCSYHGLALNIDMDLTPFEAIDPCGYPNLAVTQCRNVGVKVDVATAGVGVIAQLLRILGYNAAGPEAELGVPCADPNRDHDRYDRQR